MRSAIIAIAFLATSPAAAMQQFGIKTMGDLLVLADLCEKIEVNWPAVNAEMSAINLKLEDMSGEGSRAQEATTYMVLIETKIKEVAERQGFELSDFACYMAETSYGPRGMQVPYLIWPKASR